MWSPIKHRCVELCKGGMTMAELISEYVDTKHIRHSVEHITLPADDAGRERMIDDILNALRRKHKSARS